MKIAIMQPYFFPYIGYFQLINAVDTFVIYDDVNYIKKGWINRNRILINNKPYMFTLSLGKVSQNELICDTKLSFDFSNWRNRFFEQLRHSYHRAPYYDKCIDFIRHLLDVDDFRLNIFLGSQIKKLAQYFGIYTEFLYSSKIAKNSELRAQDKIIDICKRLGAKIYINLIGGRGLYKRDEFLLNNIELVFLESNLIEYKQFNEMFTPNLSIIDVMMFNSQKSVGLFLEQYRLDRRNTCCQC
jgi:hypothetical protein